MYILVFLLFHIFLHGKMVEIKLWKTKVCGKLENSSNQKLFFHNYIVVNNALYQGNSMISTLSTVCGKLTYFHGVKFMDKYKI